MIHLINRFDRLEARQAELDAAERAAEYARAAFDASRKDLEQIRGSAAQASKQLTAFDLDAFSLEGPRGARYRQSIRRLEKDGGRFEIVEPPEVPALLPERGVLEVARGEKQALSYSDQRGCVQIRVRSQ